MDTSFAVSIVGWVALFFVILTIDIFGYDYVVMKLAEQDKWWSPYRQEPQGGHIHFYSTGLNKSGGFAQLVYGHIPDWDFHEGERRFYKRGSDEHKKAFPDGPPKARGRNRRLKKLRVVRVGFFKKLYKRRREWTVIDERTNSVKVKEVKESEQHIFFYSTEMAVKLDSIPTADMGGAASGKVSFNVLLIGPEKAEFIAGKWESVALDIAHGRASGYIRSRTLKELQEEKDTEGKQMLEAILQANDPPNDEDATKSIVEEFGIMIDNPRLVDLDFNEVGDTEVLQSLKRKTIAENDLKTAEVEEKIAETRGRGKAKEYGHIAGVPGGVSLRWAEAIEETKVKAIDVGVAALIDVEK